MSFSFLPAFLTVFPLNHTPRAVSVRLISFVFTIAYFARYFKMVRHILYILRVFVGVFPQIHNVFSQPSLTQRKKPPLKGEAFAPR
jgi:hypothetical protein